MKGNSTKSPLDREDFEIGNSHVGYLFRDKIEQIKLAKLAWMKGFVMGQLACEERVLMKDGVWMVPVEDRPKGWEGMGGKEVSRETS